MTICVCIANKNALALAADSALTCGDNYDRFILNDSRKVYKITKNQAIGAVDCGASRLNGMLIDDIIDGFSDYLDKNEKIRDLFDIEKTFIFYIKEYSKYYKLDEYADRYARRKIRSVAKEFKGFVDEKGLSEEAIEEYIAWYQSKYDEDKAVCKPSPGVTDLFIQENLKYATDLFREDVTPDLDDDMIYRLLDGIAYDFFYNDACNNEGEILFAGFGSDDCSPKCFSFSFYFYYHGHLLYNTDKKYDFYYDSARLIPLAQEEPFDNFTRGISDCTIRAICDGPVTINDLLKKSVDKSSLPEEKKTKLKESLDDNGTGTARNLFWRCSLDIYQPINDVIDALGYVNLAKFAQGLVDLTSFNRKYFITSNSRTVGGPTDVAYITKQTGFVWYKNKEDKIKEEN